MTPACARLVQLQPPPLAPPACAEDILLIRAMRDSNVPKFLEHDLPLFKGIVADLFPGVDVPFVDYGKLQAAIEDQLEVAGLQRVPALITKIIQSHETQLVRHGMMVSGRHTSQGACACCSHRYHPAPSAPPSSLSERRGQARRSTRWFSPRRSRSSRRTASSTATASTRSCSATRSTPSPSPWASCMASSTS